MLYFSTLLVLASSENFSLCTWASVLAVCVGPYVFLGSLFSNILSVFSFLNMQEQVSHPHKADKSVFLYVLMVIFLDSEREKGKFLNRMIVILIYFHWKWKQIQLKRTKLSDETKDGDLLTDSWF